MTHIYHLILRSHARLFTRLLIPIRSIRFDGASDRIRGDQTEIQRLWNIAAAKWLMWLSQNRIAAQHKTSSSTSSLCQQDLILSSDKLLPLMKKNILCWRWWNASRAAKRVDKIDNGRWSHYDMFYGISVGAKICTYTSSTCQIEIALELSLNFVPLYSQAFGRRRSHATDVLCVVKPKKAERKRGFVVAVLWKQSQQCAHE